VGKVLLAALPRDRALGILRRTGLPRRTPATITDVEAFSTELDAVRERGWAVDDEEQETGVRCLAVPLRSADRVHGAVSLSGPVERFGRGRDPGLVAAMQRVSRSFVLD
jgi:IclR family acetate operon transcriptional repressor